MACKCSDTGSKKCRRIFSTPEPWRQFFHEQHEQERTQVKRAMQNVLRTPIADLLDD